MDKAVKNVNTKMVYVHDDNLRLWNNLERGDRSGLLNWTLRFKFNEYLAQKDIESSK